ncbi:hypothetical protein EVAR_25843_1 [Eumeta japonica]|uniref:Uncharacterized protein n=1 Tax=Eumeta variegata TaxID=151549 RepID=A0A4C1VSU6_EUMVA|nr:hypothetical protein EVAR_25843_1 [Eumeta japonica]
MEECRLRNRHSKPSNVSDASTDEIDLTMIALTNRQDGGRERAGGSSLGSPEVSARYSRIDKSKNAALRRASAYPTPEYRSRARALQRSESSRSGIEIVGATSEKSNHPTKRFGVTKRSKQGYTPILKTLIIQAEAMTGDSRVPCRLL